MKKVFISYRREDAQDAAGRICDRLAREFGQHSVFMDVDNIPFGVDFREHLHTSVMQCDILLAVIGKTWLDSKTADGLRRLDNPDDFVRFEIELALKQPCTLVIPLMLHGTPVPSADKLPGSLKELAYRAAVDIRHTHFQRDLDALVEHLQGMRLTSIPAAAVDLDATAIRNQESTVTDVGRKAPPLRALRESLLKSGAMRVPPARTMRKDKRNVVSRLKDNHIFKNKRVIAAAAVVALLIICCVLYAIFNGDGGSVPMIPRGT
jgi:hypothetical protein